MFLTELFFSKKKIKIPTPTNFSLIEIMIAYSESKGAVFRDPIRRREAGIHKIEDLVGNGIALKADFSGYNALGVRGVVDSADRDRRELSAVLAVENNAVDAVRERAAVFFG